MMKVAIVLDDGKLPIFERHLKQSGYAFENAGHLTAGTRVLRVDTSNVQALAEVIKAANTESAMTGAPL